MEELLPTKRLRGFAASLGRLDLGDILTKEDKFRQLCQVHVLWDLARVRFALLLSLYLCAWLQGNLPSQKMTSNTGDGKCAMRGSCGKKGFFGKPLPCPYDGPPVEVHFFAITYGTVSLFLNSPMMKILDAYSAMSVAWNSERVQSVARQTS